MSCNVWSLFRYFKVVNILNEPKLWCHIFLQYHWTTCQWFQRSIFFFFFGLVRHIVPDFGYFKLWVDVHITCILVQIPVGLNKFRMLIYTWKKFGSWLFLLHWQMSSYFSFNRNPKSDVKHSSVGGQNSSEDSSSAELRIVLFNAYFVSLLIYKFADMVIILGFHTKRIL